jgi:hypothetical protein
MKPYEVAVTVVIRLRASDAHDAGKRVRMATESWLWKTMLERSEVISTEVRGGVAVPFIAEYPPESARPESASGDDCDCAERSWYRPWHDSACPLAGEERFVE